MPVSPELWGDGFTGCLAKFGNPSAASLSVTLVFLLVAVVLMSLRKRALHWRGLGIYMANSVDSGFGVGVRRDLAIQIKPKKIRRMYFRVRLLRSRNTWFSRRRAAKLERRLRRWRFHCSQAYWRKESWLPRYRILRFRLERKIRGALSSKKARKKFRRAHRLLWIFKRQEPAYSRDDLINHWRRTQPPHSRKIASRKLRRARHLLRVFGRPKSPYSPDSFIGNLIELRDHILWALSMVLLLFVGLIPLGGQIYEVLACPLLAKLPESGSLIAVGAVSPFFVPMKAAFFVAVCVAMPYVLREIGHFVALGLYKREEIVGGWLVASAAFLFYLGMAFAYFLVFHVVFGFIAAVSPEAVSWSPDINELFGFTLALFFAFGLAFEVPVAVFILARANIVELEDLKRARPYVIVGAFVVAAIVTPPDVISQLLLAIPCCLLYEVGLMVAEPKWRLRVKKGLRTLRHSTKISRLCQKRRGN